MLIQQSAIVQLKMPLNAIGWTTQEDEKLIDLVEPHRHLHNSQDPSRKRILTREETWKEIAVELSKPVEEIKKRWRGLRDGYTRSKRIGAIHKSKLPIFEKMQFLDMLVTDPLRESESTDKQDGILETDINVIEDNKNVIIEDNNVITDNQEYYEITLADVQQQVEKPGTQILKIIPKIKFESSDAMESPPIKIGRRNSGRKKSVPFPRNIPPIKILPKPMVVNEPKIIQCVKDMKTPEQKSPIIEKLIERLLKENTNEIDVFFRSMAASVKKLQPNLIPKIKMEVCNVIAKYEMQSFDKNM